MIVCKRCGSVDNYYTEVAGPHIKATCIDCNRYIKFIPKIKPPQHGLNAAPIIMSTNLSLKIDLLKVDKAKLYKGEKGTYLDAIVIMKDEPDQYGNIGMIVQEVTKEERAKGIKGAILGNARYIQKKQEASKPSSSMEDLPF